MPHPQEKRILFGWREVEGIRSLKTYKEKGGYEAWMKLLKEKQPSEVIDLTKASGLRGRGGAGFPTGMKWSFVPNNLGKPKYLCVNCDESEPGTCKDREIVEHIPHQLLEGIGIACYAVGIQKAFIYIRGEMYEGYLSLKKAIEEAYAAGLFGKNIGGTDFECDIVLHRGAGAYICGEESARLSPLETAVSGRIRALCLPHRYQQRGNAGHPAAHFSHGRGRIRQVGHG